MLDKETGLPLEVDVADIPEKYERIWYIYFEIDAILGRIFDGVCRKIPPSEYLAYSKMTGIDINPDDFELLTMMDTVYCQQLNILLDEHRNKDKPSTGG